MYTFRRLACSTFLGALLLGSAPAVAHAEEFISPFVGVNFSGDSGCPSITNCSDQRLDFGVSLALVRYLFGIEEELAYAKDFFGKAPGLDSSVLTFMGNFMVAPQIGAGVRPYGVVGVGLMRTHIARPFAIVDDNQAAWDVGGGILAYMSRNVGIRGDVRYFHAFQDTDAVGLRLRASKLNFGRASIGLVLRF